MCLTLECAVCMHGAESDDSTVVTIVSGYAVCSEHADYFSNEVAMIAELITRRKREREYRGW